MLTPQKHNEPSAVEGTDTVTNFASLIDGLNQPQKEAVLQLNGPLLILAGAGSGKTRALTHRMAALIEQRVASPDEILCVTFTNKAAREMENRIHGLLESLGVMVQEKLWISTFHSTCVRILKKHIDLLDYKNYFTIYDDSDQLSQIKRVCDAMNLNDKLFPAKNFKSRINTAKMLGLSPQNVEKSSLMYMDDRTVQVFTRYEEEMKKANALDFGDLLLKVHELFRMYPAVLEFYQDKFRYIMVDEYQDTNRIQYLLVKQLADKHHNLCVVGDEDQSIYSWRGADISNILNFEKDFPEAKVIKLEENYRSSGNIVEAATRVIKNNSERKDKTLFTSNAPGELISVREEKTDYDEAKFVARRIQDFLSQGDVSRKEIAIFYRTNAQSRLLEEQFRLFSIPYKLVGGVRFYDRLEIKDIVGYLKLILNPSDDLAFKRVINSPARGIGKTTLEKLEEISFRDKISLLQSIEVAALGKLVNSGTAQKLRGFAQMMDECRGYSDTVDLSSLYSYVLEKTQYVMRLKTENTTEANSRIENLEELSNAISQFEKERTDATLQSFLEEMSLVSDIDRVDENTEAVTLMTLHVSKGLEYPYVFIVGLEENLFPSQRGDEEDSVEEERRLCYVGMTRARKKLFLTYTRTRKVWGQDQYNPPSRFLKEIPEELVQFTTGFDVPRFAETYGQSQFGSSGFGASGIGSGRGPGASVERNFSRGGRFGSTQTGDTQTFPDYDGSWGASEAPASNSGRNYVKGSKVRHPTFGVGTIYAIEGSGDEQKISIVFSDQSVKKFVAKYARLEAI